MGAFEELSWRGLVQQTTAESFGEVLAQPITLYSGFDPTAPSLHAGNLVPLMVMTHAAGRTPGPAARGRGDGMIGDPSGKTSERQLLEGDVLRDNTAKIRGQIEAFFANDDGPPVRIVNNLDWLGEVRLLEFLRDIGKHFAVNQMIQRDSVGSGSSRASTGSRTPSSRTCCCRRTTSMSSTAATAVVSRSAPPISGGTSSRASTSCAGSPARPSTASPRRCSRTARGRSTARARRAPCSSTASAPRRTRSTNFGSTPPTPTWGGSCAGSPCGARRRSAARRDAGRRAAGPAGAGGGSHPARSRRRSGRRSGARVRGAVRRR